MPRQSTVTRRELVTRINRKFKPEGKELLITRGRAALAHHGEYYVLDAGVVIETHVDLEQLGRDLGMLAPSEAIEEGYDDA